MSAPRRGMSEPIDVSSAGAAEALAYKTWLCRLCGFICDERDGRPEEGIPLGTR